MSGVNTDLAQMQAFLDHLCRFDQLLDEEFRSMIGHWRELGGVWTDAKYHEVGCDLEEVSHGVRRYLAADRRARGAPGSAHREGVRVSAGVVAVAAWQRSSLRVNHR